MKQVFLAMVVVIQVTLMCGCEPATHTASQERIQLPRATDYDGVKYSPGELDIGSMEVGRTSKVTTKLELLLELGEGVEQSEIKKVYFSCKCLSLIGEPVVGKQVKSDNPVSIPIKVELTTQSGDFEKEVIVVFGDGGVIRVPIVGFVYNKPNVGTNNLTFTPVDSSGVFRAKAEFTYLREETAAKLYLEEVNGDHSSEIRIIEQGQESKPNAKQGFVFDVMNATLEFDGDFEAGSHNIGDLSFVWKSPNIPNSTVRAFVRVKK